MISLEESPCVAVAKIMNHNFSNSRVVHLNVVNSDFHNRQLIINALAHAEIFHKTHHNLTKAHEYEDLRKQIENDHQMTHKLLR